MFVTALFVIANPGNSPGAFSGGSLWPIHTMEYRLLRSEKEQSVGTQNHLDESPGNHAERRASPKRLCVVWPHLQHVLPPPPRRDAQLSEEGESWRTSPQNGPPVLLTWHLDAAPFWGFPTELDVVTYFLWMYDSPFVTRVFLSPGKAPPWVCVAPDGVPFYISTMQHDQTTGRCQCTHSTQYMINRLLKSWPPLTT